MSQFDYELERPQGIPVDSADFLQDTDLTKTFLNSQRPIEFIDHQYTSPVSGINISLDFGASYLQRFNIYKKGATLVWLMRARNKENTNYIYWRSPNNPSTSGVSISTIDSTTVETVGNVYEEL
jgi:hypothetical protein